MDISDHCHRYEGGTCLCRPVFSVTSGRQRHVPFVRLRLNLVDICTRNTKAHNEWDELAGEPPDSLDCLRVWPTRCRRHLPHSRSTEMCGCGQIRLRTMIHWIRGKQSANCGQTRFCGTGSLIHGGVLEKIRHTFQCDPRIQQQGCMRNVREGL